MPPNLQHCPRSQPHKSDVVLVLLGIVLKIQTLAAEEIDLYGISTTSCDLLNTLQSLDLMPINASKASKFIAEM